MTYLQIQWKASRGWEPYAGCTFYKLEEIQKAFEDIEFLAERRPDMHYRLVNIVVTEICSYGWKEDK